MSEQDIKSNEVQDSKKNKLLSKNELIEAFSKDFSTSVTKIYINSLDEEKAFREITVKEQKTLTRIMAANERRKDVIYDAQCALINEAALDKDFDICKLSEFDRLKLMIALYQANMFQNDVKFTCEECGAENVYRLDFDNVLKKLDSYDLSEKKFHYENKNFKYDFVIAYPSVKTVSEFHASYCRVHNVKVARRQMQTDEQMQNMEYVNLFMKSLVFENKNTGKVTSIDFTDYKVGDLEDIVSVFPQDVLYSEEGVLKFIVKECIQPLNDAFDKHECWQCHTIHEKDNVNQAESFF